MATATNEEIVGALMTYHTVEQAARAVGLSRRTVYARMKGRGFQLIYQQSREAIAQTAASALQSHVAEAVQVISQVMMDEEATPAVRLQAAGMLLTQADKFTARVSRLHRESNSALSAASSFPDSLSVKDADEEYG